MATSAGSTAGSCDRSASICTQISAPSSIAARRPGAVGGAEAGLPGAVDDVDPAELVAELLGELAGAIGAGVVDDQHVGRRARRARTSRHNRSMLPASL